MNCTKISDKIYNIGVQDPDLRVFDIIMETKKGTTYNSYIINDDKVAIIDTVKNGYFDEYLTNVKSIIGDKKVDYIVVQHTEPDHCGSIKYLIEAFPEALVVGSKAAMSYTRQIVNYDFNFDDSLKELSLGEITLKFISAPYLHWPDTIFTYAKEHKVLFTCDFFGCHYCPTEGVVDTNGDDYFEEMKYYYDVIMSPFSKFVIMGLDKIKDLEIAAIAPSHGPIHEEDYQRYIDLYRQWAMEGPNMGKNIQVFYVSAYGYTESMAKYLVEAIRKRGVAADAHEITSTSTVDLMRYVQNSTAFMVGSPTINQDAVKPIWDLLSVTCPITNRGKVVTAFGSHGWSGEAIPMMLERMRSLKLKTVDTGLTFKFAPSEEDFKAADILVDNFLANIK